MKVSEKKKSSHRAIKIVAIVLAAVILLFVAMTIVVAVNMNKMFGRYDYDNPRFTLDYYYEHYEADYPRKSVTFVSGENTLQGHIYGEDNDKGLLVFAHGINSGYEHYLNSLLWFVDNGWRVFGYDATGSGNSGGDAAKGLSQSALDLDAALDYIELDEELSGLPIFLMGHSWGGYAVAAVMNFGHKVDGIISVSGYAEPVEMLYEFAVNVVGNARFLLYPSLVVYNKAMFGEYSDLSAVSGINSTDTPVLIVHGTEDEMISYNESAIINNRDKITNPNVEYLTLENCTHSGMFYADNADDIYYDIKAKRSALKKQYGGNIPEEELEKLYSGVDMDLMNKPNEEFLSQAEKFCEDILKG